MDKLYTANHINLKEADVKLQLEEFISSTANIHEDKFLGFCPADNRLDHFYREYLKGCDKYKDLWKVMVIVFTISHGQSQIEWGLCISKEVTIENLGNKSLCAQRLVYDTLKCCQKDPHDIEITAKMVTSCKTARSRYVIALEQGKKLRENKAANNQYNKYSSR